MREQLQCILAASLVLALADFVLAAHVQGARSESYAAVALPLALFAAAAIAAGLAGSILGAACASLLVMSRQAAASGFGLAGSATAALVIAVGDPFAAFASWPRQALLWIGVWAVLGILLSAAEANPGTKLWARLWQAAPALLAGIAVFQLLRGADLDSLRWAALATGGGLFTWAVGRPRRAIDVNAALASALLIAPWLGPAEPSFEGASGIGTDFPLDPPRVILITLDTLRADEPGFAGGAASTPNLDRLADESVVFERAYSTSGWTLPALASLHTGVSPWVHGAWTWADRPSDAPLSLAERFHGAGYRTAKIGFNFFLTPAGSGTALEDGFQVKASYPKRVRPRTAAFELLADRSSVDLQVDASTDDLFAWTEQWIERDPLKQFFLWLHVYDPHQPYLPPAQFAPSGVAPSPDDPAADPEQRPKSREEVERMRALYRGEIAYVDDRLGKLLEQLRRLGLYDDSLIAITSDHGDEFYEHGGFGHGHSLHDELLRVPLIVKLPGAAQPRRIAWRISTLGLAPTLLSLANIEFDPADFSGRVLALEDQTEGPLFAAGTMEGEPQEAVIFDGLKLIRHPGFGNERLYDLQADPGEQVNLATQRPEDVRRGLALLQLQRDQSGALRTRLGISSAGQSSYGSDEIRRLRSLGYVN